MNVQILKFVVVVFFLITYWEWNNRKRDNSHGMRLRSFKCMHEFKSTIIAPAFCWILRSLWLIADAQLQCDVVHSLGFFYSCRFSGMKLFFYLFIMLLSQLQWEMLRCTFMWISVEIRNTIHLLYFVSSFFFCHSIYAILHHFYIIFLLF